VSHPSTVVTSSGDITPRTRYNQMYANKDAILVTAKTPVSLTFLGYSSTARMDTPVMTRRLNAADPTIVDAPRIGGLAYRS